ncbi:MAG: rhodanese-like domain-containing protein [Acidobacteriota bacterium]|nr:rhodanese-like domain-containing protein [Acidobacteriota bacterium]
MLVRQITDDHLAQNAYLIGCQQTGEAIVIDPERDIERYIAAAAKENLKLVAAAETHIHADFLSGTRELARRLPALHIYLSGDGGPDWLYEWPATDGRTVTFLHDGDTLRIGKIEIRAWYTPGHTPEHMSFVVTDHGGGASEPMGVVSGDFVFVGDLGRPDLLETAAGVAGAREPSARRLHESATAFLTLPDFMQVWPGHGAGSACGKALGAIPTTTVGYERRFSPAIAEAARGAQPFVDFILSGQPEPPGYFARMKRLNKSGPPILESLPAPLRLDARGLVEARAAMQVIDTRKDRKAFMRGHVAGSFFAPFDKSFPTVVGSLADPGKPIALIIDEADLEAAVRDLVRIGYDDVRAWAPPSIDDEYRAAGGLEAAIESIDFAEFERRRQAGPITVLDVRGAGEHAARHVPGAVNVAHTRLRVAPPALGPNRPVYVHCAAGVRSSVSAAYLAREGMPVVHVDGSFTGWKPAP